MFYHDDLMTKFKNGLEQKGVKVISHQKANGPGTAAIVFEIQGKIYVNMMAPIQLPIPINKKENRMENFLEG